MSFLIILSCLVLSATCSPAYAPYGVYHGPPAPLAHDGRVVDTPEVAHAKAAHLAAYSAEAAKAAASGGYDYLDGSYAGAYNDYGYAGSQGAYHGPPAPLAHDGRVVDTPEVAHAKAAHLAAHAEQLSKISQLSYLNPYPHPHW